LLRGQTTEKLENGQLLNDYGFVQSSWASVEGAGQGRSKSNTAGGAKKISGGAKYLSSFLKFEVKNNCKSVEEAKR